MYTTGWGKKLHKTKPKGFSMSDELRKEVFQFAKCGTRSFIEVQPLFPDTCTERSIRGHLQRMGIRLRKMNEEELKAWKAQDLQAS